MAVEFFAKIIGGRRITITKDVAIREDIREGDWVHVRLSKHNPEDVSDTMKDKFDMMRGEE